MKITAAFPLLALATAACAPYYDQQPGYPYPQDPQGYPQPDYPPYPNQGYPQPYPPGPPMPPGQPYPGPGQPTYPAPGYPSGESTYRAVGTEPFWDLEIGRDLIFTDRGNNVSVSQPAPQPINGVAGETYRTSRLEVNIVHRQCNDGMSDRSYPDTVDVRVDGRQRYRGCGAPIEYFNQVGEDGQPSYPGQPTYPGAGYPGAGYPAPGYPGAGAPPGMPVANLTGSNWRIVAINGIRTPASNFYMNFMPDQIGAKFGCNSMSASYTQTANSVRFGPVAATRMACPDMTFERQGSSILSQPVTVSGIGGRITLSNARGSIELVQAR